jgi:hypothetical protein
VLKNAKIHAKEHGFNEETPELVAMIKANIVDEKWRAKRSAVSAKRVMQFRS